MININAENSTHRPANGFALLEVLVSVLILAFGMMGMAGLIIISHKANSSSYLKQQAIQSAYDMVDRMRANNTSATLVAYNVNNLTTGSAPATPSAPAADCVSTTCTPAQLATYDAYLWQTQVLNQLPNGSTSIVTNSTAGTGTSVSVTVRWNDSPAQKQLGAATATPVGPPTPAQFTFQTVL